MDSPTPSSRPMLAAEHGFDARSADTAERTTPYLQSFEQLLASGGDERIAIDPSTGRNRYGIPRGKACEEAWFSSSTATAISPRGYHAALQVYGSVIDARDIRAILAWFDRLRARLTRLFGIPGSAVILSASGTELELIALFLARGILRLPLTNLVIAPEETGRGVPLAAAGRHFLGSAPFGEKVERGLLIEGFESPESAVETIEIRDKCGMPLSSDFVDNEVVQRVEANVSNGRCALIHLLDCSKTERRGLRRSTASALMARYSGRVLVAVDSCQLRCSPEQIRADLHAGFMVMITGSKFAGGPPFAGAILLPPEVVDRLHRLELPAGLLAYMAAEDWPADLRGRAGREFIAGVNVGAGLRWEAALAELERFFSLPAQLRESVAKAFANAVQGHVRGNGCLEMIDQPSDEPGRTIFPIVTVAGDDRRLASEIVHRSLRLPLPNDSLSGKSKRIFHVGQPVPIGSGSALRVCLSASQVVDAAENIANGQAFGAAVAPLMADIDGLFLKWERIAEGLSRRSRLARLGRCQ
jgi:hypothetical protein